MFREAWSFDTTALDLADKKVVESPKLMQRALKRQQGRLRTRFFKIVRVTPGPPHYPLRWKSEKQRRYVMAKLRRENNLPYQRTGRLNAGWDARFEFDEDGGAFVAENDTPYADYVIGREQQPFHSQTGWIYAPDALDNFAPVMLDVYEQTWRSIADPFVR